MIVGADYGGNYATDFEFNGVRGYEATGQIHAIVGFVARDSRPSLCESLQALVNRGVDAANDDPQYRYAFEALLRGIGKWASGDRYDPDQIDFSAIRNRRLPHTIPNPCDFPVIACVPNACIFTAIKQTPGDAQVSDLAFWPGDYFGDGNDQRELTPELMADAVLERYAQRQSR
jgi:hypothetical protein